ncbi:MAG: hypothetical protein RLZZ488_2460 [Pseudomonadota bacterium]|jgi:hypothetical protein
MDPNNGLELVGLVVAGIFCTVHGYRFMCAAIRFSKL